MSPPSASRSFVWFAWGLAYLVATTGIVGAVWRGRVSAIAQYDSAAGQAEWGEWKGAAETMAKQGGPLTRRPPKGNEFPALVLLRDHFAVSLSAILFAFTALYVVLAVLVTGAFRTPAVPGPPASEDDERRQRGL